MSNPSKTLSIVRCLVAALAVSVFSFHAVAEDAIQPAPAEKGKVDEAVDKGLRYLVSQQQPNGAFHKVTGLTALAVMSFMASGNVPGEGPYHQVVERGIANVISEQSPGSGVFAKGTERVMYSHGMCTLLLGEAVGMTHEDSIKTALPKAIEVIKKAQMLKKSPMAQGGWRYGPSSLDSDMSVTCWQMLALRAARDSGVDIPDAHIKQAVSFVKRCSAPAGGFGYQGPAPTPSTTACAMVALQMAGEYDAPEVWKAADYFLANPRRGSGNEWFFYTTYYGTFAMYQCGGKYWDRWQEMIERQLLPMQKPDGSWLAGNGYETREGGTVYCTSMSLLALSVEYHYLPAYQR